ncbi:MAG: hypothetical protein ACOZF2_10550 [Thermodesulfobacteriota bacterium]
MFHLPTFLSIGAICLISAFLGLIFRGPYVDGPAIGYLITIAASNLCLYLFRYNAIDTKWYLMAVVFFIVLFGSLVKIAFKDPPDNKTASRSNDSLAIFIWLSILGVIFILLRRFIHPEPYENSFFQAWFPLYISSSFEKGIFLLARDMSLGQGFMTSAMNYASNSLGIVALGRALGINEVNGLYYIYNSSSITCLILTYLLLLDTLRRKASAMSLFFITFVVFLFLEKDQSNYLGANNYDEILYLGGALCCYFLFNSREAPPNALDSGQEDFELKLLGKLRNAAIASTFLVFGRNYGAFFSLFFLVLHTGYTIYYSNKKEMAQLIKWQLLIIWGLFIVFVVNDFYIIIKAGNIYYPRIFNPLVNPYNMKSFIIGFIYSWGLSPITISHNHFVFNFKSIYLYQLSITVKSLKLRTNGRQWVNFVTVLGPLIFLILPLLLEVIVRYRISYLSKLYYFSIWFFAWFPCYLYLWTPAYIPLGHWWSKNEAQREIPVKYSLIFFVVLAILISAALSGKSIYRTFVAQLSEVSNDALMVNEIERNSDVAELQKIVQGKILYFHYEPGIQLRYFLGGDLFADYDYWSDPVQNQIKEGDSLEQLLCRLGGPNIYLSYGFNFLYGDHVNYPKRSQILADLINYEHLKFVKKVYIIKKNYYKTPIIFLQIDREKLHCQ